MQMPFLRRVAPESTIVPLLIGHQTEETARELGDALALSRNQSSVLIASTNLSHYENATVARGLDAVVLEHVRRFDPDGLQSSLQKNPVTLAVAVRRSRSCGRPVRSAPPEVAGSTMEILAMSRVTSRRWSVTWPPS